MTRDDARKIQQLAGSITKLTMPSDPAASKARNLLADMAQMSFLILPNGPDKIDDAEVRKAWRIDGDPVPTATNKAAAKAATPKA